jgi:hypothetical protein
VKFPIKIKYRGRVHATIYGKSKAYPFYRLCFRAAGKRVVRSFAKYAEAKAEGDLKAKELHDGSHAAALTSRQSLDAVAAFQCLETYNRSTGRNITLLGAVSKFVDVSSKLGPQTMDEAADGFLSGAANVHQKGLVEAADDFIKSNEPKTKAGEGQRAQLSSKYHYNRAIILRRFAATYPANAVCDLTKDLLVKFIAAERMCAPNVGCDA